MGSGLLVNGVSMYGFVVLANAVLSEENYSTLSVLWGLTFAIGPGVFLPLEQEVSRALASRRSRGVGALPLIQRAARLACGLALLILLALALASSWLADELFSGEVVMVAALGLSFACFGVELLVRGTLSGVNKFGDYAGVLGLEGFARIAIAGALAIAGVKAVGPYGFALAIGPLVAAGLVLLPNRGAHLVDGPPSTYSELSASLGFLLAGSVLTLGLMNIGPATVQILAGDEGADLPGLFLNALIVARVPLFLFQAVQAALLPSLADHAGAGRLADFRQGMRQMMTAVSAVGLMGVVGAVAVGPLVAEILFGGGESGADQLGRSHFLVLGASMAIYMLAMALAQALIALHHEKLVAGIWAAAAVAFALTLSVVRFDTLARVEVSLLAGSAVAGLGLLMALRKDESWQQARTHKTNAAAPKTQVARTTG